jgi:hypothetical protein
MSSRELWALSVPLAVLGWVGLAVVTAFLPFSPVAALIALPLLLLAVTFTAAPIIWLVAQRLKLPGPGERPVVALRVAFWLGLWAATAAGLQLFDAFSWLVAITLAVIFGLIEGFLQQQSQS